MSVSEDVRNMKSVSPLVASADSAVRNEALRLAALALKEHQDASRPFHLMTYSDVVPKVPVYILYFTTFPNPTTGTVEFWPDLYDYDRAISRELQAFLLKR